MSTKYTRRERADILKALKAAKQFLWDGKGIPAGKQGMICFCIDMAYIQRLISASGATSAQKMIMGRLEGNGGMYGFLRNQGISKNELTYERVQAHRLAWLDLLITEFSEPLPCPKKSTN